MSPGDLDEVNDEVNRLPYMADGERYGSHEFWQEIDQRGGDCEDFAIGKLNRLAARGWPVEAMRLATVYDERGGYHAVLMVRTPEGDMMLDNRQPRPVPADQVKGLGYRPHKIQLVGGKQDWYPWL